MLDTVCQQMNMGYIMQYGILIVKAIGVALLAIVAIKFISFAIQYLLGMNLYRRARSKYVSQKLREKARLVIADAILIATASLGGAIFITIFMWCMVTGAPYLTFVIRLVQSLC